MSSQSSDGDAKQASNAVSMKRKVILTPKPPPPKRKESSLPTPPPPPKRKESSLPTPPPPPDALEWFYLDHSGKEFGPCSTVDMHAWYYGDFFPMKQELRVRLAIGDHHVPVKKLYPDPDKVFEGVPRGLRQEVKEEVNEDAEEDEQSTATIQEVEVHEQSTALLKDALARAYSLQHGWPVSRAGGKAVHDIILSVVLGQGDNSSDTPWMQLVRQRLVRLLEVPELQKACG